MVWSCLGLIQVISTCCLCLFRCFMHRTHRFSSPPGSLGPWMHFLRWSKPKVEPPHSIISLWISHFSFKKNNLAVNCSTYYISHVGPWTSKMGELESTWLGGGEWISMVTKQLRSCVVDPKHNEYRQHHDEHPCGPDSEKNPIVYSRQLPCFHIMKK